MATQFSIKDGRKWKLPFYSMWGGQKLSLLGSMLVSFGLIWFLTEKYQSATVLSMASMAGLLPRVLLSPFIGPFIDRWDRKKTMIVADATVALVTLVLSFLFFFDVVEIWHIYLALFLRSAFGAFHHLASYSTTPLMVPKEKLTNISGLDQSFSGGMNIASGPLGAILLGLVKVQGLLLIDVFTALIAIGILVFVKVPSPDHSVTEDDSVSPMNVYMNELKLGFKYIFSWKGLIVLTAGSVILNFLITPGVALLALMTTEHFHKGALELGLLEAAFGMGVLLSGLLLSVWGGFKEKMKTVALGVFMMGIGLLLFGISPEGQILYGYVAVALIGISLVMVNAPVNGSLQENIHPEMQGRVASLTSSLCSLGTPIGLMIAGPVSDAVGIETWFLISGIIFIAMAPIYLFNKSLKSLVNGHPLNGDMEKEFGLKPQPEAVPAD